MNNNYLLKGISFFMMTFALVGNSWSQTNIDNKVTFTSAPGEIKIENKSSQAISLKDMILTFSLQQKVPSWWGDPWLDWKAESKNSVDQNKYIFVNHAYLPGNKLSPGQTIRFQYNPEPWNTTDKASNIHFYSKEVAAGNYCKATVSATAKAESWGGVMVTIVNTSGAPIKLESARVLMKYAGTPSGAPWGSPWQDWKVATASGQQNLQLDNQVPPSQAATINANGQLVIEFNGGAGVAAPSNIDLMLPGNCDGEITPPPPPPPPPPPAENGTININFQTSYPDVRSSAITATITGPSYPTGTTLSGQWDRTPAISATNLLYGTYTLTTSDIVKDKAKYVATIDQPTLTISSATAIATATVTYVQELGTGSIKININNAPQDVVSASPKIKIKGPGYPQTGEDLAVNWGTSPNVVVNELQNGTYSLSSSTVTKNNTIYTPELSNESPVISDTTKEVIVNVTYKTTTITPKRNQLIFGLMNEPYTFPGQKLSQDNLFDSQVAAIKAIRDKGLNNLILISGNYWDPLHGFVSGQTVEQYGDKSNGEIYTRTRLEAAGVNVDNVAMEVHQYFNYNYSGLDQACTKYPGETEDIRYNNFLKALHIDDFPKWMKDNKMKAFLGEFGAADNDTCVEDMKFMMRFMTENSYQADKPDEGGFIGWAIWRSNRNLGQAPNNPFFNAVQQANPDVYFNGILQGSGNGLINKVFINNGFVIPKN